MLQLCLSYSYKKWIFHHINFLCVLKLGFVWGRAILVNLPRAPGSIDSKECRQEDKFFAYIIFEPQVNHLELYL